MKLYAVVVTYYPEIEDAIKNIMQYLPWVDHLVIWENTPSEYIDNYRIELPEYADKVSFMGTGKNEGIAFALNRAVEYAKSNGFTHILTMDQDSYWEDFDSFKSEAINRQEMIISPNINNAHPSTIHQIKAAITSGSIYNLSIFDKIGLFNETYFIDAVDTEFCYRAYGKGFITIMLGNHNLKQTFGKSEKKIMGTIYNYSAFRRYYQVRNHLWLWRAYPRIITGEQKEWILNQIFKESLKVILFENNKITKLKSILTGTIDGLSKIY